MSDAWSGSDLGVQAITAACSKLYPDQHHPLQVQVVRKYCMGGPDPLDYISMYSHAEVGDSPPHWHYVTYGLSKLYGSSSFTSLKPLSEIPSGFGFELTFRLKREPSESSPPTWPASLLQSIARYVYNCEVELCSGDDIPWKKPLEEGSESSIRHMLLLQDSELQEITTPFGYVNFLQIVGLFDEELRLVQRHNGVSVADAMRHYSATGGPLLITDMRRGESIIMLEPDNLEFNEQGSNLSGVTTPFTWQELSDSDKPIDVVGDDAEMPSSQSRSENNIGSLSPSCLEFVPPCSIDGVHLKLSIDAARMLPMVIADRLLVGKHFTFTHSNNEAALTLVPNQVTGAFVSEDDPFVARAHWLQMFLPDDFLNRLMKKLSDLPDTKDLNLPVVLCWSEERVKLSILGNNSADLSIPPPIHPMFSLAQS